MVRLIIRRNNYRSMWKEGGGGEKMAKLVVLDKKDLQSFGKVVIIGDLHGDLKSLKSALRTADSAKDGIIFLGDYADRGQSGIEVINIVDSLIKKNPRNVFALKGNHEDYPDGYPGFDYYNYPSLVNQVKKKRGSWEDYFKSTFEPFVDRLQLAIIVPGEMLFVHGGISSKIESLKDLEYPTAKVEKDILWSDPTEEEGESPSNRGAELIKFGPDITKNVCKKLSVKKIIRSHEPSRVDQAGAPCYSHGGRVLTTSTTTAYYDGITHEPYRPYVLSISTADFSVECYQIFADKGPEKTEIVSCRS